MESVLSQNWPSLEYLVVNPGSTDETQEIIHELDRKYPGRIIHITERDNGPADGLNKGFARATGDLFGYLNADDIYLNGCFRSAVEAAMKFPNAAAIYADGYVANAEGKVVKHVISTNFSAKAFVYGGVLVLQQSTFYRAEAFRAVGGFNLENRTSWDAEILLDMSLRKMPLVHVSGYWAIFRIHEESITGSQRFAEQSRLTYARYFEKVMGRPKKPIDELAAKMLKGYWLLRDPHAAVVKLQDILGMSKMDQS